MKIVVGGSMAFAKEQLEAKRVLESMGHEVLVTDDVDVYVNNPSVKDNFDEELKACLDNDIVRSFFKKIENTDAYVVINKEKNGARGYLGASVLMEIGLAYHLGKKVFLLEEIDKSQSCALEVAIINPTILNGDLSRVGFERPEISLKEVADRAREIQEEIGLNFDDVLNKFTQEVGELNDAVQKRRGRFCKKKALDNNNLKDELGDVMFNLISICNGMNINPDELSLFAKNTLGKFEERKELYKENLR